MENLFEVLALVVTSMVVGAALQAWRTARAVPGTTVGEQLIRPTGLGGPGPFRPK
jgi:hypothetical protein